MTSQADCVVEVSVVTMRNVFQFTMDGTDVGDVNLYKKFIVDADAFATEMGTKLGNGNMNYPASGNTTGLTINATPYLTRADGTTAFDPNTVLLKYDMPRDVSAKVFGPNFPAHVAGQAMHFANVNAADHTDMFHNETALRNDAHDSVNALVLSGSIYTALDNANGKHTSAVTVDGVAPDNGPTNIGRHLLQQILALPIGSQRTENFAAINGVAGAPGTYHMPLIENDAISFNVEQINTENDEQRLSDNPDTINRTIRCILLCKTITDGNITPLHDDTL